MVEASWQRNKILRAERFKKAQQRQRDPILALNELWEVYVRRVNEGGMETETRLWVQLVAEALRNPRIGEAICSNWNDVIKRFMDIIESAQKQGKFSPDLDSEMVARLCVAVFHGLMLQKMLDKDADLWKFGEVASLIFGGISTRTGEKGGG